MTILVDADACPVKEIIIRTAREYHLPVHMFIDCSHILESDYAQITVVEKGRDSVDFALVNHIEKGDIVVTQDFGVASMALGKQAYAINHNGFVFSEKNINRLLFERHLAQKIRRAGGKTSNPRKRSPENDRQFEKAFKELCRKALTFK